MAACAAFSCHAGPYLDLVSVHAGAAVKRLARPEIDRLAPQRGDLAALLAALGPPTHIERWEGAWRFDWLDSDAERTSVGVGFGALGFHFQLFDRSEVRHRSRRVHAVVEGDRVTALGVTPGPLLTGEDGSGPR